MRRRINPGFREPKTNDKIALYVALISLLGTTITALVGYLNIRTQIELPIHITQTAEAGLRNRALPTEVQETAQEERIVFSCGSAICVMNTNGTQIIKLTEDSIIIDYPDWSPDEQLIVFAADFGNDWEIYTINTDGSHLNRLTDNPGDDKQPRWSPNGKQILFVSKRDGNQDIFVMNADGTGAMNLTRVCMQNTET